MSRSIPAPALRSAAAVLTLTCASAVPAKALEMPETSYRAEGSMRAERSTVEFVQYIDWPRKRMRMEMASPDERETTVIVYDMTDGSALMFGLGEELPEEERVAIRTASGDTYEQMRARMDALADAEPIGTRTVHGEDCSLYRTDDGELGPGDERAPGVACVTDDGIVVQYQEDGSDAPSLEVTRLTRGEQDPALFTVPPGYRTLDTGNLGGMFSGLMDRDRGEAAPDSAPDQAGEGEAATPVDAVRKGLRGLFRRPEN
jgi:hypothetical protein